MNSKDASLQEIAIMTTQLYRVVFGDWHLDWLLARNSLEAQLIALQRWPDDVWYLEVETIH